MMFGIIEHRLGLLKLPVTTLSLCHFVFMFLFMMGNIDGTATRKAAASDVVSSRVGRPGFTGELSKMASTHEVKLP